MIVSSLGLLCPGSCERTSCPDDVVRYFKMSTMATILLAVSAKNLKVIKSVAMQRQLENEQVKGHVGICRCLELWDSTQSLAEHRHRCMCFNCLNISG